jgi:hypothetical protein
MQITIKTGDASIMMKKDWDDRHQGQGHPDRRAAARSTSRRRATSLSRAARSGSTDAERMSTWKDDPFEPLAIEEELEPFATLAARAVSGPDAEPRPAERPAAATARLHGFDLDDRPLLAGVADLPGEILPARSTVALRRSDIGSDVVLLFEAGNLRRPIIVGVLQAPGVVERSSSPSPTVAVQVDDDRMVITAEREIVLALRRGEHHADARRQGPDQGHLRVEPVQRLQQDQGCRGGYQLGSRRTTSRWSSMRDSGIGKRGVVPLRDRRWSLEHPGTDVTLIGSAIAPQNRTVTSLPVSIRVGDMRAQAQVFGERGRIPLVLRRVDQSPS